VVSDSDKPVHVSPVVRGSAPLDLGAEEAAREDAHPASTPTAVNTKLIRPLTVDMAEGSSKGNARVASGFLAQREVELGESCVSISDQRKSCCGHRL
jgi:hypothetical protein